MRILRKVVRKRYFRKAVYTYEQYLIPIPSRYRDLVKPFLNRDLDVAVEVEGVCLTVRAKPIDAEKTV